MLFSAGAGVRGLKCLLAGSSGTVRQLPQLGPRPGALVWGPIWLGHAYGRRPHHQLGPEAGSVRDQSCEYPARRARGCGVIGQRQHPLFCLPTSPIPVSSLGGGSWAAPEGLHPVFAFACTRFDLQALLEHMQTGAHDVLYELVDLILFLQLKSVKVLDFTSDYRQGMKKI